MRDKKGLIALNQLVSYVLLLVVIGIMLVVGLKIMAGVKDEMDENTSEWNASKEAMEGLTNVSEQQGLMGTVIVFGAILSIVIVAFMFRSAIMG